MALNPSTDGDFTGRITAADTDYPYGSSKDETTPGAGDGTPYIKKRADDIFGFQQALLEAASITPNGNADTAVASQYLEALRVIFGSGAAVASGSTTFTNATNNIALTGVGAGAGIAVGDVISVTGTANNDGDYTVEVITDADNIIVNQAHAGGSTSKSLTNETVSATVTLKAKSYNAPPGLGQGWVGVTRTSTTSYTNNTGRTIALTASTGGTGVNSSVEIAVDGLALGQSLVSGITSTPVRVNSYAQIPPGAAYSVDYTPTGTVEINELR